MITKVIDYGKMIKFSHSIFALPFAGISVLLVFFEQKENVENFAFLVFAILVCMISARSAAMGFNRILDKEIDTKNPRTKQRELATGSISKKSAISFVILSSIVFHIASYWINLLCFYLSFPALYLLLFYSYTKRLTFLCHYYLGFCIGLAPLGAWLALTGKVETLPILWSLGLMFAIAGFDILYALQDKNFDKEFGLNSIPAKFGQKKSYIISAITHILAICLFFVAGFYAKLGFIFYLFLAITGFCFFYQHRLAFRNQEKPYPALFYQLQSFIGVLLFLGILLDKQGLSP